MVQVVDSISRQTRLKGCVLLCFAFDCEKPPGVLLQKAPGGEKYSVLAADLGEKWLLCVQPV